MQQIFPSPYQVGYGPKPSTDISDFEDQYEFLKKETEETSKAPKILPGMLNTVVDQIGEVFLKLLDIRGMLEQAKQNTKQEKEIDSLKNDIDDINEKIFELSNKLTNISL